MRMFTKLAAGLAVIFIPLIIVIFLIFKNLSGKSFYPVEGSLKAPGLKNQVKIYFDSYGVPHIFASENHDTYFTMGYMHARDRLWQMDISRRAAEGKLAEILGNEVVKYDMLFRTIGIHRFAYHWYLNISPVSKKILDSYAQGVNRFIEENYNNLPVEFDALGYKPEQWKAEHSLMIARMMAWELNISWFTDWITGSIINKVGIEKASEIFPDTTVALLYKSATENDTTGLSENLSPYISATENFVKLSLEFRNRCGISISHSGSNSWVISPEKSAYGKPILCNDPHLFLSAPSKWYEIHLKSDSLDVRGMSIAGVPGIVIGNNRYIAWGLTNLMCDDNDFIILKSDETEKGKYIWGGKSYYPDSLTEHIKIKNSGTISFTVKNTIVGPLISDLNFIGIKDFNLSQGDRMVAFRWTGFELSDEVLCFHMINKSSDWQSFRNALKNFSAPAQNFIYADINGNIGYQCAGKIPIRNSDLPVHYISPSEFELVWEGFVEFDKLPSLLNPPEGYIVTANTNPSEWLKNYRENSYISYLWEPSSRFEKINEFLKNQILLDTDECAMLQNNITSFYAESIVNYINETFKDSKEEDPRVLWCLDKFSKFKGDLKADKSIPSVYASFLVFLIKNTFEDELGKDVFNQFITVQNIPYRSLERIIKSKYHTWFDDINTPEKENRNSIIIKSLRQTVEYLSLLYQSPDPENWKWGHIHKLSFSHIFGSSGFMDKAFNIGEFQMSGDQTTPSNSTYSFKKVTERNDFSVSVGASMRIIINLADIEHPLTINSTGQSGQPLHPNYKDQSRKWYYGEYKKCLMNETEMIAEKYNLLVLLPE